MSTSICLCLWNPDESYATPGQTRKWFVYFWQFVIGSRPNTIFWKQTSESVIGIYVPMSKFQYFFAQNKVFPIVSTQCMTKLNPPVNEISQHFYKPGQPVPIFRIKCLQQLVKNVEVELLDLRLFGGKDLLRTGQMLRERYAWPMHIFRSSFRGLFRPETLVNALSKFKKCFVHNTIHL